MDPEIQESLNILRPPVQRLYENQYYFKDERQRRNVDVYRDLLQASPSRRISNSWNVRDTTSSLTLVVNKSDEHLIEKHSVLSYTELQYSRSPDHIVLSTDEPEERPIIKVTVIPNNAPVKRKKKSCSKRIQTTVSNQESSIKSENVYLVVKNRKREKVYEIKGTGSAEFSKTRRQTKNDEIAVNKDIHQLLKSLNMETKKKKGRIKRPTGGDEEVDDEQFVRYSSAEGYDCTCPIPIGSYDIYASTVPPAQMEHNVKQHLKSLHEKKMRSMGKIRRSDEMPSEEEPFEKITYDCKCQPRNSGTGYRQPKKGQVKITGKLGLNHDDQYVLQCDASIDDQPLPTIFQTQHAATSSHLRTIQCECTPEMFSDHSAFEHKNNSRSHKDSTVQVDMGPSTVPKSILCPAVQSSYRSQETQCKPAHFNQVCFSNIDKLKIYAKKDEILQCNCDDNDNLILNSVQKEGDMSATNYSNPLVIISVYPKPEGTHSREASPTRAAQNTKPAIEKQTGRRANTMKPKIEKKPIVKKNSPIKPEQLIQTPNKPVKPPTKNPVKTQKAITKTERNETRENTVNKTDNKGPRSRSSSPPPSPARQRIEKSHDNKTVNTKKELKVRSPDRNTTQLSKVTEQKVTIMRHTETKTSKPKDSKFSAEGSKARYSKNKMITDTSDESSQELIGKAIPKTSKAVNTDVTLSKKAILDTFARVCECVIDGNSSWEGQGSQKKSDANTDASNVAVSIDGENEFYGDFFRNGERIADVQDQNFQNILYNTDEGTPRKISKCYAYNNNQTNDAVLPRLSGIIVRDSIELFHRRADESNSKLEVTESLSVSAHDVFSNGNNNISSVKQSKHYTGDSCQMPNPIERDREIRELLGIEKPKSAPTVTPVSSIEDNFASPVPTPVGTPTNTPVLTSIETPATSARNSEQGRAWFPAAVEYSIYDKCAANTVAPVRDIAGISPNIDITSRFSKKMDAVKNTCLEKVECMYEVYQADVRYTKHRQRAQPEVETNVRPKKSYKQAGTCCCPDDILEKICKKVGRAEIEQLVRGLNTNSGGGSSGRGSRRSSSEDCVDDGVLGRRGGGKRRGPAVGSRGVRGSGRQRKHDDDEHLSEEVLWPRSDDQSLESDGKKRKLEEKKPKDYHKRKANEQKKQWRDVETKSERCCNKRSCKKSSSECSEDSSSSSSDSSKLKKEKKEKKEKKKKERKQKMKKSISNIKEKVKKVKARKGKCTCLRDLTKLNTKCCTTYIDPVLQPGVLKCQSTSYKKRQDKPVQTKPRKLTPIDEPKIPIQIGTCCKCEKEVEVVDKSPVAVIEEESVKPVMQEPEEPVEEPVPEIQEPISPEPTLPQPGCQQLVLNRNINIYLQIEKFCKQKPILLSRKQYDKIKRAIEGTGYSSLRKSRRSDPCCSCSVGEVVEKEDIIVPSNNRNVRTVLTFNRSEQVNQNNSLMIFSKNQTKKDAHIRTTGASPKQSLLQQIYQDAGQPTTKIKDFNNIKARTKKTQYLFKEPEPVKLSHNIIHYRKMGSKCNNLAGIKCAQCGQKNFQVTNCSSCKRRQFKARYEAQCHYNFMANDHLCNICRMVQDLEGEIMYPAESQRGTRRATSSAEIHYTNFNPMKRVTFSSSNLEDNCLKPFPKHDLLKKTSSATIYTIFKGRRKTPTPNFGTSIDSLSSENISWKSYKASPPIEDKSRRPFLKRLMSCLVMRSKTSEVRFGRPIPKVASMNSSIDSYHINTSLGGIDLSSSIYDTSVSFYTNHSILPTNGLKMKRGGFLSSVKGFLTYNRKT